MNEFFNNIKADLVDRRMRLPLIAVGVLLVLAVGYTVLGAHRESASVSGGQGGGEPGAVPSLTQSSTTGASATKAASETTYGGAYQHGGQLVDPFRELPKPKAKSASAKGSSSAKHSSGSSSKAGGGGSSSTSSGGSGSSGSGSHGTTPKAKPKPHAIYAVNVEFGLAPASPSETPHLVLYKGIRVGKPVPDAKNKLAVLASASLTGNLLEGAAQAFATFRFDSDSAPPIVDGPASCLPSETQCESIKLEDGKSEELQYTESDGTTVTYLLHLAGVFKETVP